MGAFKKGQTVLFGKEKLEIQDKFKGNISKIGNYQGGILTGQKSNPCTYLLSNGFTVRGDKLKHI